MKNNNLVVFKNGKMSVSSLELVEQINIFREQEGRAILRHKDLLVVIREEFEEEIAGREISPGSYKDKNGQNRPMFKLTPSQAKQLMARESKYVRKILIKYIERLEDFIREKCSAEWQTARTAGKMHRLEMTDAIRDKLIPLAIEQGSANYSKFYMVYSKMINSLLKINSDMRDNLPWLYLTTIDMLERIIENIISAECDKGTHYKEIYQVCKAKCAIAVEMNMLPKLEPIKQLQTMEN